MCIIVYKPAGVNLPPDKVIDACFSDNPDGAGFMYHARDNSIIIHKGLMTVAQLRKALSKVDDIENKDVAIHFRFATHGSKSKGNTHPFPITRKIDALRRTRTVCDYAIMHNGIINTVGHKDKTLSDTMILVKMLSGTSEFNNHIQKILNDGKFVVMDKHETRFYGTFIEDYGCYFSNFSYTIADDLDDYDVRDKELLDWYNEYYGTNYKTLDSLYDDLAIMGKIIYDINGETRYDDEYAYELNEYERSRGCRYADYTDY